ncbi:hypothetical protein GCM10008934_02280 [Virgibacillus salarius]|uniref:Panacea domain-containing protein n=1 Tax=Virgibacillus salarius TaxID=447199 RepID=UPI0031D7C1D2
MYHHFILLHSDYSQGRRIAFHRCDTSIDGIEEFSQITSDLKQNFPYLSFGFHHLQTDSKDWRSVFEYDMFFKNVFPVSDLDSFKKFISEDDQISALDVANLITTKISCTHLKLQKLLFFFYEEYIASYKTKPFPEKFLAWDYGPVIREVYDVYKSYGRNKIEHSEDNSTPIIKEEPFKLSVYSRFKKTPVYGKVLEALDGTLNKYGDKKATELVELTHQKNEAWDQVFQDGLGRNQVIEVLK